MRPIFLVIAGWLIASLMFVSQAGFKPPMPDIYFTDVGCACVKAKYKRGIAQTWELKVWASEEGSKPEKRWERIISRYPVEDPSSIRKTLDDCRKWMDAVEKTYKLKLRPADAMPEPGARS